MRCGAAFRVLPWHINEYHVLDLAGYAVSDAAQHYPQPCTLTLGNTCTVMLL